MPRTLWFRVRDRLLGSLDRSSRFDQDCRQSLPGWPAGLMLSRSDGTISVALQSSVGTRAQPALSDLWSGLGELRRAAEQHMPPRLKLIEGGRHAASHGRRHSGHDMHTR